MITLDRLKEVLIYNQDTGIFLWNVLKGPCKAGSVAGCVNARGYILLKIDNVKYAAHRMAWLYVHEKHPEYSIDHINGIKTDNRISNLREATHAQNIWNRPSSSNSKFIGVSKNGKNWRAKATVNKERFYLGTFKTAAEASNAYKDFIKIKHGEYFYSD